jgi:hypothetical protein
MTTDTERRFPVLVSTTNHYVVWVEGENAKDAADHLNGDSEWYEAIEGEHPRNYDYEIRQPDEFDWPTVYETRQGPAEYCAHCDRTSDPTDVRPLWHNDDCPKRVAS